MFNIDLKKAETALNAGRLDEAFAMLTSTPRRFHADGQRLVDRLVVALLDRGNAHYQQLRFGAARDDASLAKQLGGPQVDVEHLLQQVDARDHSFVQKATQQSQQELVDRLSDLVKTKHFEQAAALIATLSSSIRGNAEVQRLMANVGEAIRAQVNSDLRLGRLDRAIVALATLEQAGIDDSQTVGLRSHVDQLTQIVEGARQADYALVLQKLKLQQQVYPDAKWIQEAIAAAEKCAAAVEEIFSGPLGFVEANKHQSRDKQRVSVTKPHAEKIAPTPSTIGGPALLHVDQLGSLLILTESLVTIGTTTSSSRGCGVEGTADVVLQTEGGASISLQRSGEDYLAQSAEPFVVNDRSARQHLLSDGDTIEVGKRGRLKFLRSVTASDSAVLKITGCKMKQRQIRSIVLMGDSLVFGPTSGHFRLPNLKSRVIMRPVSDREAFLIHQQGHAERQSLSPGASASFDGCKFIHQRSVS